MPTVESRGSRGRVLLVDADWQDSVSRAEGLLLGGWEVDIATSVEAATATIDRGTPDAIITSEHLSGPFDGRELARRLKRDASTQHLPILVLTDASDEDLDEKHAKILSCGTYLAKPCDVIAVVAALEGEIALAALLASRRARREGREAQLPANIRSARIRDVGGAHLLTGSDQF